MGNAQGLTSKARVDPLLMRLTSMGKEEIIALRMRHFHDLGGRFALGRDQFSSLLKGDSGDEMIHTLFDTDRNSYVDSSEVIACLAMISSISIQEKIDVIHALYDFNDSGQLSLDVVTMLLRTVAVGCSKMDPAITTLTTREAEELAKLAFRRVDLDSDGDICRQHFDDFCFSNPTVRNFLDYWSEAANQVALPRGELFQDLDFRPDGSSLYFNITDAPDGMLPIEGVVWLRPKQFCPGTPKLYADGSLGAFVGSGAAGATAAIERGRTPIAGRNPEAAAAAAAAAAAVYGVGGSGVGCIKQGQMANCWFLNALSLVASKPRLLRNLFVATGQEKQGRFCLQFFKEERWRNVPVDDCLPCNALGKPLFTTSTDPNEIWPMLVEKAYAKLHGCYTSIVHGEVQYALRDLTGGTVERVSFHKEDSEQVRPEVSSDAFWTKLKEWAGNGTGGGSPNQEHCMGVAWTIETEESLMEGGTLKGLQFAVMHTVVAAVEYKQFRLLRVRNPWPNGTYFDGDWSNGSEVWAKAPKQLVELAIAASGDGSNATAPKLLDSTTSGTHSQARKFSDPTAFWMAFDDFVKYFDTMVVVHLHGEASTARNSTGKKQGNRDASDTGGWSHQFRRVAFPARGGGSPGSHQPDRSWNQNPQFFVDVPQSCEVFVSLSQRDARYHGGSVNNADRPCLGVVLHKWNWGPDIGRVRCLERLSGDEDASSDFDPTNSMLRVDSSEAATGLVVRNEPFRNTREVNVSAKLHPGQYVIIPMTFDPSAGVKATAKASAKTKMAIASEGPSLRRRGGAREFWLSVFSNSPLHPLKLYSDADVEYEDRGRVVEGVDDLLNAFSEDRLTHETFDKERDNESVALEALSKLIGEMWMTAKQLEFRKEDLELKIGFLEEEKRRKAEEAAEAAAAAAEAMAV